MKNKCRVVSIQLLLLISITFVASSFANNDTKAIRAVSLNGVQNQLRSDNQTQDINQFFGLKEVMGFIIDETESDLIIFGKIDPELPPLYLEDFVLALRNAWLKFAPLHGNTYQYSFPGCSIDPNPKTIQRLQEIGNRIANKSSTEDLENELKAWHRICGEKQSVRVMGIPFNTRFAQVMVEADYDMKQLVDGKDDLDIPGFTSLVDVKLEKIRNAIINNKQINFSPSSMNRFWFYPGENIYEEDQGIVLLNHCPVTLLTEEMFLGASGNLASGYRADPLAQDFAESFSIMYDKVAYERPIYTELQNLFRFVALAKILEFKNIDDETKIDISYLLDNFSIKSTIVDKNLPGRSGIKEFQHKQEFSSGYHTTQLWLPSCGGVSIATGIKPEQLTKNKNGLLSRLKSKILSSKPSEQAVAWDVHETKKEVLNDIHISNRALSSNQYAENFTYVTISHTVAEGYKVFAGKNDPICVDDISLNIFRKMKSEIGRSLKEMVVIDLSELRDDKKKDAFKSTFQIEAKKHGDDFSFEIIDCTKEQMNELISLGEIRVPVSENTIQQIKKGKYKNYHKLPFTFHSKNSDEFRVTHIDLITRTKVMAQACLERLKLKAKPYNFNPVSLRNAVKQLIKELGKSHNIKKKDVIFQIKKNTGNINIGGD